jgi:hypothetical protein
MWTISIGAIERHRPGTSSENCMSVFFNQFQNHSSCKFSIDSEFLEDYESRGINCMKQAEEKMLSPYSTMPMRKSYPLIALLFSVIVTYCRYRQYSLHLPGAARKKGLFEG